MIDPDVVFAVLAVNQEVRRHILDLLKKNEHPTAEMSNLDDLVTFLKGKKSACIFVDSEAVESYGTWIVSKIRTACRECRLILLCSQSHRNIVRRIMELGAYGCILEPYAEWELLTMMRPILADLHLDKRAKASKVRRQDK